MKKSLMFLALFASFNANANLIVNGGFEDYTVAAGTAAHVTTSGACTGVTCITDNGTLFDWAPATGAVEFLEVRNAFVGAAQEGSNFAELNPTGVSGITQTFSALAGLGSLSWYDKGRSGEYLPGNYGYSVLLNGATIFSGLTTAIDTWTQLSFTNLALLDGANTLTFLSTNAANDVGAQIDNIVLDQSSVTTAVPEPETYGMMMAGLAMLGFASRRRKTF